jgi:hypothetical protein
LYALTSWLVLFTICLLRRHESTNDAVRQMSMCLLALSAEVWVCN